MGSSDCSRGGALHHRVLTFGTRQVADNAS